MRNAAILLNAVMLLAISAVLPEAYAVEDPRETADPGSFVQKAAQDGMTEVELGKLAQHKSQSADVKAFGARMVEAHSATNAELTALAKRKQIKVPSALDGEHRTMVEELSAKSGSDFDSEYARHMAAAHDKAISLFTQATQGQDADLAAFASKTLPALRDHKRMADSLQKAQGKGDARESTERRE